MKLLPVCVLAAVYAAAGPRPGIAQALAAGVIDGVVSDTNLVSLPGATASILGSNVRVTTGANGHFRINGLRSGEYILVVQRLGFEPVSAAVQIVSADTLRMAFPLQTIVKSLDAVVIVDKRETTRLSEFDARRKSGFGHFITTAEIEKRQPITLGDLFQNQLTVVVGNDGHGREYLVNNRMLPVNPRRPDVCPFQIYVDDILQPNDPGLRPPAPSTNQLPGPKEIAAVEIYSGAATIPLRYKSTMASFCGVILIWTKSGQ